MRQRVFIKEGRLKQTQQREGGVCLRVGFYSIIYGTGHKRQSLFRENGLPQYYSNCMSH